MKSQATLNDPTLPVAEFIQIDAACDRFEAAYHAGQRPELADLPGRGPGRGEAPAVPQPAEPGPRVSAATRRDSRIRNRYRERFPELADGRRVGVPIAGPRARISTQHRSGSSPDIDGTGET